MTAVTAPVFWTFALYLGVHIGAGVWLYKRNENLSDFVLGGRSLGSFSAALSAQASDMSGWLLLGLPGAIYASGLGASWIAIGLLIGTYLNWKFVASRLRTYTEFADDSLTLSAYFESRFEDSTRSLRLISAILIIVFFCIYVSSGLVAGGILFEQLFGWDATLAITVTALVIIVYTFLGGFLAASYTDVFQGLLMFFALLIVPVVAVIADGGFGAMVATINDRSPSLLSIANEAGFDSESGWTAGSGLQLIAILSGLAWGYGYFGQPHILARFMGIRSARHVMAARSIAMIWVTLTLAGAVLIGLAGIAFFEDPLGNPETVFLELITAQVTPWIAGILLVAVLAAVMSTADSQLLVASSSVTEDLYRAFFKRGASQRALLWVGRWATIGVAVIAYLLALRGGTVLGLVAYAWAGFGAAFGTVILLSLYWPRMTAAGALASMVSGAVTVVAWRELTSGEVYEMIPGVIVSVVAAVAVSLLTRPPSRRSWAKVVEPEPAEAGAGGRA